MGEQLVPLSAVHKQLRPLLRAARAAGWRERPLHRTGGVLLYPPDRSMRAIPMHSSCADKLRENIVHQLRAGGLDV